MSFAVVKQLKKQYPYAAPFLTCFVPLEELSTKFAQDLPPPTIPLADETIFGKSACEASKENIDVYLDASLLATSKDFCATAAKCVKEHTKAIRELAAFLKKDEKACKHLVSLVLLQKKHRIGPWAKKHGMQKDAAALVATYMARCAAARIAKHAKISETWTQSYCPVCGRLPNAGYIQTKEGHRFLHCQLCSSTWRFPRTACPACGDDKPEGRLIFNLEGGTTQQRAEGCKECKYYLLVPDIRDMAENIPLSILLFCLMPMDMLMQDQGYKPLESL